MRRTRVLVAEDSLTVRKRLIETLEADPDFEVVGEAADGRTAIELCEQLRPDVITLDMMMPHVTGLAATEYIMAYCPTPIVIVSASVNRGEIMKTLDALAAGAVDVLEKPTAAFGGEEWDRKFKATLKLAARIKVITHVRGRLRSASGLVAGSRLTPAPPAPLAAPAVLSTPTVLATSASPAYPSALLGARSKDTPRLVAIGASTGGPAAVIEVLKHLPRSFQLPVLLVLHIGKPFGSGFAEWLGKQIAIPVAVAEDGEILPRRGKARVVLAPPEKHLLVREGRLRLTNDPERHSCRPSVDVLFESVAREGGPGAVGCLLTGMGRDGAEGLLLMKQAGATTLVQDEATSVVFGMPREALRLGAADRALPINEFVQVLSALAKST